MAQFVRLVVRSLVTAAPAGYWQGGRAVSPSKPKLSARRTAVILTGIALITVLPFVVMGELPGEAWLSGREGSLGVGALGAGLLAADIFLPIPSTVVGSLLGLRLGLWWGALWAWLGLVVGSVLGYGAGRLALEKAGMELPAWHTGLVLFVTRPVPILAEVVAIAAGAGHVPFSTFVIASVAGNAVFAFVLAASGAALMSESWAGVGLAVPMALPVLGFLVLRRLRKREQARD